MMLLNGYIYILTNQSMPNIVKVGKTKNNPEIRLNQLSSATGVPEKFELYKSYEVTNCDDAERFAHLVLERVFGRPNLNREFFSGQAQDITSVLDEALVRFLVKIDDYDITYFSGAMSRLMAKEFTIGKLEFEKLFSEISISESKILNNDSLLIASGAYVTCCYAKNTQPYKSLFLSPILKDKITKQVIKFAEEFESDPVMNVINFIRRFS